jgi:hypothetical protein
MLRLLVTDDSDDWKNIFDFKRENRFNEKFFSNECWKGIFENFTGHKLAKSNWIEPLTIDCLSSVKAYGNLVADFLAWIHPYIDETNPALVLTDFETSGGYDHSTVTVYYSNIPDMEFKDILNSCSSVSNSTIYDDGGKVLAIKHFTEVNFKPSSREINSQHDYEQYY